MLYGATGVALTDFNTRYVDTTGFFTGVPGLHAGWTLGDGEYAIINNWSVRPDFRSSNLNHTMDFLYANPNANMRPPAGFLSLHHLALHMANVFGLPYRIFVCALGILITMLSVTGVYIWWKKRRAQKFSKAHRGAMALAEVAE